MTDSLRLLRLHDPICAIRRPKRARRLGLALILVAVCGCQQSPYTIRPSAEIRSRLAEQIADVDAEFEIVAAAHTSELGRGGDFVSCYEVEVVLEDPLENSVVAQCALDAAAAMFTELLDMIDEDKQTAHYDAGLGFIAVRIHESRDARERHLAFWETREKQIVENRGAINPEWPAIDPRWIPLVSYSSSGKRGWMELELAGEISGEGMAISPRVEGFLSDEPSVAEVSLGEEPPERHERTEVVKRVTEQALDPRLVGTWKACDATVDRFAIGDDGAFVNRLHSSTRYPNGIRGGVRIQLWNDTPVLLMSTSASGKDETLACEFEFVTDDIVVLRYRPYPPDRNPSPEESYFPAGFALSRMTPEGMYSEDDHARVRKINEELQYFVPR